MKKYKSFVLGVAVLMLSGCGGKGPQLPSRHLGSDAEPDSATVALMEFNYQMAQAADKELLKMALESEEPYAQYQGSAWALIIDKGDENAGAPKRNEKCVVHVRTYTLAGKLLTDEEKSWNIGHFELPLAIDANIIEWNHGAHVRILSPWYAAYGLKGTENVPPYENVIFEVEIR